MPFNTAGKMGERVLRNRGGVPFGGKFWMKNL